MYLKISYRPEDLPISCSTGVQNFCRCVYPFEEGTERQNTQTLRCLCWASAGAPCGPLPGRAQTPWPPSVPQPASQAASFALVSFTCTSFPYSRAFCKWNQSIYPYLMHLSRSMLMGTCATRTIKFRFLLKSPVYNHLKPVLGSWCPRGTV